MVDEIDEESINALRAKIVAMKAKCMTSGAKISGKKRLSAQGCGAAELPILLKVSDAASRLPAFVLSGLLCFLWHIFLCRCLRLGQLLGGEFSGSFGRLARR